MRVKLLKRSEHTMTRKACSIPLKFWAVAHRPLRGQCGPWQNPASDDAIALWSLCEAPPGGGVFSCAFRNPVSGAYLPLET